jgi:hypothetical protein
MNIIVRQAGAFPPLPPVSCLHHPGRCRNARRTDPADSGQWAEIKYRQPEKQQAESYRLLAAQANRARSSKPTRKCPSR